MRSSDAGAAREGVVIRTRWLRREFIPFDEMAALSEDGSQVVLTGGRTHAMPDQTRARVGLALSPPAMTGRVEDDATALVSYIQGPWSPVRAADLLLSSASRAGASDIHIEDTGAQVSLRLRLARRMVPLLDLPPAEGRRLVAALKHRAGCLPYRTDLVQEGRIPREGVAADVRASFMPTALGERTALRLFGRLECIDSLGLSPDARATLTDLLAHASGLVLIAGPSGGGKTTTVYAALAHIAETRGGAHLSIEDPVEQRLRLAGIAVDQVELDPIRGLTAEAALQGALRQDVDVVALSEIRSPGEARLAVQAAHTGRLVIAGLHAGSPEEARQRLLDLLSLTDGGTDTGMVDATLHGVLHQHLVAVPCDRAPCSPACPTCKGAGQRLRPQARCQVWRRP